MQHLKFAFLASILPAAFFIHGCSNTECASGTYDDNGQCKAGLAPDCGPGTSLQGGQCVPKSGGGLSCGKGAFNVNGACVGTVTGKGNVGRWTNVQISVPNDLGNLANGPLADSYGTGSSLELISFVDAGGTKLVYGGGATKVVDAADAYLSDHTNTFFGTFQPGATCPGATCKTLPFDMKIAVLGPNYLRVQKVVLSDVTFDDADGVPYLSSFTFSGVLTPADGDMVFVEAASSTVTGLIGTPFDVDTDGDSVPDAWTLTASVTTEPKWAGQ